MDKYNKIFDNKDKYYPCYLVENNHGADIWVCSKKSKTKDECIEYWKNKGERGILDVKVINSTTAWKEWLFLNNIKVWE